MNHISAKTEICMVIGDPVDHSLSPQLHNAGYKTLKIEDQFVFVACRVRIIDMAGFAAGVRIMGIRGVSCTMPHKIEIMKHLDKIDETAKIIGAVNTVVNEQGVLKGYNTDWLGVVTPLGLHTTLKNKSVALLGAGGAARAALYGLRKRCANVTIFNRSVVKAQKLAKEFNCTAMDMRDIESIRQMDIIFNATSVGLAPNENDTPLPKHCITAHHIVFDAVYVPEETRLIREARSQGAQIIHGIEMLLHQGVAQFELYTRQKAPVAAMRKGLLESIRR